MRWRPLIALALAVVLVGGLWLGVQSQQAPASVPTPRNSGGEPTPEHMIAQANDEPRNSDGEPTSENVTAPASDEPRPAAGEETPAGTVATGDFDGELALGHVAVQVGYGPRPPGSAALRQTGDYIIGQLEQQGWEIETQEFTYLDTPIRNIIARGAVGQGPIIILGAHYDTRPLADQDANTPDAPVMGANDGGSGVGVLLELARVLDRAQLQNEVWLAFFDAEDSGGINGWDWIVGSSYMAENLTAEPQAVIVVDMIGDADQQIFLDRNSDADWSALIWDTAAELGYGPWFISRSKYAMLDDHTPFAQRGIPAVDIIDFDYPPWHTIEDTFDKLSADSLARVGHTLKVLLENGPVEP